MRSTARWARVAVGLALLLASACTQTVRHAAVPRPAGTRVSVSVSGNGDPFALSWERARTTLYHPPDVLGFAEGVVAGVGTPVAVTEARSTVPAPAGPATTAIYTDYPFRVLAYVGAPRDAISPYPVGATITLRVPGGVLNGRQDDFELAPVVIPGMHLYALIRDQGSIGGGNAPPSRLVVSTRGQDLFTLLPGGKVVNQRPGEDGF